MREHHDVAGVEGDGVDAHEGGVGPERWGGVVGGELEVLEGG